MAIFAVVPHLGGTVANIVVGDNLETVEQVVGECVEVTEETGPGGIGSVWNAETQTFELPVEIP